MRIINYINYLHVHSEYSNVKYYDAINKVTHIPKKAKELGLQVVYDACIMIELRHKGGV